LLDTATGAETRLPDGPGDLIPLRPLPGGEWLAFYNSSRSPGDIVRARLDAPRPDAFLSVTRVWDRTALRPADLAPAESFTWPAGDGLEIQGWLYRAPAPARGLIVYVHGGPTGHSADALNLQIQYFVALGFHVLDPNYRGSTGFGVAYRDAIKVDGWGGREQDDIRDGVAALIAAGLVEPGKVGITGTSYGGYSSWCAITRWPPDILAAAAPICGMTDLVVDYETTRPDLRPYSEEMLGGRPDQVPDRYRERSPIHFVANIRGRLLIVQGARDPNVTPANVAAVRQALDAAGVPYELLVFPDEGHGINRPKNRRVLYTRLAAFFAAAFAAGPPAGPEPAV
jgi:dipeptidyl aminopeptidase/acylaminoacyl peptidase